LRAKVSRDYKSNESIAITTLEKGEENWDEGTLVGEIPGPNEAKLTSMKMLSVPKERKKGGEMLVMGKAPCPIDHNDSLMEIEVFGSQKIRDDLRRLVRDYLNDELSLLKMNYQSNK